MNYMVGHIIEAPFKRIGLYCTIAPSTIIRNAEAIEIGDNVRIDEFCIIDGGAGLKIGSHVHISARSTIYSGAGVEIGEFADLSMGCLVLSESDDFSGKSMIGPQFPRRFKPGYCSPGPIRIGKFAAIGANSTIMPGVQIPEGVAVGAHSLVRHSIMEAWTIWAGVPARKLKQRSQEIVDISELYLDWFRNGDRHVKAPRT
jgi:acetyltransferase-like isoleucine patch superfamily enzyme